MKGVYFSQKQLKNMKLMRTEEYGPFTIKKWLRFIKDKKNIPDDFTSKEKIKERYPNIEDIIMKIYIYNKDNSNNVTKYKFLVCEKKENLIEKKETEDSKEDANEDMLDKTNKNKFISKNGFKMYTPKKFKGMKLTENRKKFNVNYKYSSDNMYSLVIKNLPVDYSANQLRFELQQLFTNFIAVDGNTKICKTSVLSTNGVIKGVAFVDFFKKEHMEKILNSSCKFKIGFSVLDIEKKKN